ncbi:hypothetical protein NHX12_001925 [Muraenolepis orangiensis]|uniref:CID domain-containing protein n=1 Tax=Muraenolepis orangiensis TaxID=630683 RepID=A0A9Q0E3Z0_9TELE|nr:hypothetical protein NHX12_001925 [Muraenolepis orangiensis]
MYQQYLPVACLCVVFMVRDVKVRRSVERIFTIWEERSVYSEELIAQFKAGLSRKDREREREKEKQKEKEKVKEREKEKEKEKKEQEKEKETPPPPAPANPKAALKSKIVAEFTPCSFIDQLAVHKKAIEEEVFREKQLEALRVDFCNKAGGNKFATDFEEGSLKLQEFVGFLEDELKTGPPLQDALGNADIFYEMQYKEVKIVANAYNAFASRVASLKRKLDALKSSLPGPEDSPIPSPSEDAPSPTGSDSPFSGLGSSRAPLDPDLDGKAMDEGDLVRDNGDPEDMDMSDEEAAPSQSTPITPLGVNLANVDLGKISSILSSITSAMKNTTASPSSRPSPGTPTTPSGQSTASKAAPPSPALASILSRVDITPEGILNALSKTNTSGFSSLLQSVTNSSSTATSSRTSPESSASKTPGTPTTPKIKPFLGNSLNRDTPGRARDREKGRELSPPPPPPPPTPRPAAPSVPAPSLESKINSFLQGNPGFSLGLGDSSPLASDWVDGTPVRDEAAGTPTQDEIMDTPTSDSLGSSGGQNLSPTAYRSDPWDAVITPTSNSKDENYLASSSSSSRYGTGRKTSAKHKEEEEGARKQTSTSALVEALKLKEDALSTQLKALRNCRPALERRPSSGARKAGPDDGARGVKRDTKGKGSPGKEDRFQRIETLVSPCTEAAPALTLGYPDAPLSGERIQTVESIRVIGRDSRHGGGPAGRQGPVMWYEEEEYMEAKPSSPRTGPPAPPTRRLGPAGSEDMVPQMPHPPAHLLTQHLHPLPHPHPNHPNHPPHPHPNHPNQPPHPHPNHPPHPHPNHPPHPPHPHPNHPPHPHPNHPNHPPHPHPSHPPHQAQFQMAYRGENMLAPPHPHPHPHHHQPPLPAFFGGHTPPIPRPPPPPMSPRHPHPSPPPPSHGFSGVPSAVMVGGVLVPVDRPLPPPHPVRSDGGERGGAGPRGGKGGAPPPLMLSLFDDSPKMPRPGTVKEHFVPRHAPPLHRPGTPGAPPPLLGRVKEPANRPPSNSRSPTPPSPTPRSPATESAPPRSSAPGKGPALLKPPASPPAHPRGHGPNARGPLPLLRLPGPRPPILPHPAPQRPMLRGRAPSPSLKKDQPGGYRGGKRPGPPYAGPFHAPKRPFLPPHY